LLHDLCPLTKDRNDERHLGHLTVGYRDATGTKRYHSIAVYQELTSAGEAQEKVLVRAFEYFSSLCAAVGDHHFDESAFAASFTDRGATLGAFDSTLPRAFEPVHRLHLVTTNFTVSYDATPLARSACRAVNFVSGSLPFHSYLVKNTQSVKKVVSVLWQKASLGRFAASTAACFVLSARIDGRPLYVHLTDYLETQVPEAKVKTNVLKREILEVFKNPHACNKVDNLGFAFSTVIYPIVRLLGHACGTEEKKKVTVPEAKRVKVDMKWGWTKEMFNSLAHTLFSVRGKPDVLAMAVQGKADEFGNPLMCSFEPSTCSFRHVGAGAVLPPIPPVTEKELERVLPEDLRRKGHDAYYGTRGLSRSKVLIPPVTDATRTEFLSSILLRVATGFYVETARYSLLPPEVEAMSCDIGLGPALVEGILARAKRFYNSHGHGRMRDELSRALITVKEHWYDITTVGLTEKELSEMRNKHLPESTEERKVRLGTARLQQLNAERKEEEGRAKRREGRKDVIATTPFLFSFNRLWKPDLLVQVKKRGGKQSSSLDTEELRAWLEKHDKESLPLVTLQSEAEARRQGSAKARSRTELVKFLMSFDYRAETKRCETEKAARKRSRKAEKEEEGEGEESEEGGE